MADPVNAENKPKLTEQDFSLIAQAQDEFTQKRYENCLQTLSQLEQSMGASSKILHNKAIVKFYKNECKDYEALMQTLNEKCNREEDSDSQRRNPITVAFNKAVIQYHLKKFFTVIEILNPIVEKLTHLDESTASSVGLLMLSALLSTRQLKRAFAFLKALQLHLGINLDTLASEETSSPESLSSIDGFSRIFKLMTLLTHVLNKKVAVVPDDGTVEFAILKAHQYYLGKDFQMAAKQLSKKFHLDSFSVEANGEDQDTCIANNMGIIHLRVRHYALAAKFFQYAITFDKKLTSSNSSTEVPLNLMSNLKSVPLHYLSAPQAPEILYNLGIAMLHLKRPKEAFDCFLAPLKIYHRNPRLWLRISEACIMCHEMTTLENQRQNKRIISDVICPETRRRVILEPSPKVKCSVSGQLSAMPNPNLEFAALCLRNAICLVKYYENKFPKEDHEQAPDESDSEEPWTLVEDENFCNPSLPITRSAFDSLVAAIYAAYSYVSLRTGNYVIALEHAKALLELPKLSDAYKMLGALYAAEALVMLDKVSMARPYLDAKKVCKLDPHDFETKIWPVKSTEAAQAIVQYNLVVTHIFQGELEIAKSLLATCVHPVTEAKVESLKCYLEIAGNLAA